MLRTKLVQSVPVGTIRYQSSRWRSVGANTDVGALQACKEHRSTVMVPEVHNETIQVPNRV